MALVDDIITELGSDFATGDNAVLSNIITRVTDVALNIANRKNSTSNVTLLTPEITECVKSVYLQRGTEDALNRSSQGDDTTYKDAYKSLRDNIVRANKRLLR